MSQEKAQLIAPIGIMTVTGMTATGVITASSFTGNIVGSAKSLVNGTDVTAGVVTGTSFVGNLTGNIQRLADSAPNINVGVTTATSFVGNLTGSVTDLTSQPAITVGLVTATSLSVTTITGDLTGNVIGNVTGNVTGNIVGDVTGNVTGNATGLAGGLGVNYNGGWTGAGTSQVRAGVVTATFFHGDGSNLDGVSSGPVSQQSIGITSAATAIDLSNGNLIHANQSANTTVSFASTANGNVYFIRQKDATSTARTITWPDRIKWEGGTAPTLIEINSTDEAQVFLLVTRDMGVTWYGKEIFNLGSNFYTLFTIGQDYDGSGGRVTKNGHVSSPVQIGSKWKPTDNWGMNYALNTKFDGSLWAWGFNENGCGGLNDRNERSSPTQVGGDSDGWSTCSASFQRASVATKTNGTLWSWGYNNAGELGHNDRANRSSPTQLPGTDWSAGESKIIAGIIGGAIKTNGSLWVWGNNGSGALGLNSASSNARKSSPTQVGTDTTWTEAMSGMNNSIAVKTDGTLWTWGASSYGQLGQNSANVELSSPTQVGTDTTWSKAGLGRYGSFATKTDGTLWTWGWSGDFGTLGHNEANVQYSSPKQVPGTNWVDVTSNGQFGPLGWFSS